ncbi:antitoxin [Arthrobacter sp. B1805]|uniref:antitoxin n=1 Tax=Arthrobacter sp. B1805 TaxID=2058892 RepID=UPI0034D59569
MGLFSGRSRGESLAAKELGLISNNPGKVKSGIAKAGAFANKRTHGRYWRHILGVQTKAEKAIETLPGGTAPAAPVETIGSTASGRKRRGHRSRNAGVPLADYQCMTARPEAPKYGTIQPGDGGVVIHRSTHKPHRSQSRLTVPPWVRFVAFVQPVSGPTARRSVNQHQGSHLRVSCAQIGQRHAMHSIW